MIFALAALLLDAWLAAWRGLRSAWRMLPGDLLGRLVLHGCGIAAPTRVGAASDVSAFLVEDPRAGRYLDVMPIRPHAQTLGRYVFARERISAHMLAHELEHVRQWQRLGPLFLPAYLASSGVAILRREHPYRANRYERAARARADADQDVSVGRVAERIASGHAGECSAAFSSRGTDFRPSE